MATARTNFPGLTFEAYSYTEDGYAAYNARAAGQEAKGNMIRDRILYTIRFGPIRYVSGYVLVSEPPGGSFNLVFPQNFFSSVPTLITSVPGSGIGFHNHNKGYETLLIFSYIRTTVNNYTGNCDVMLTGAPYSDGNRWIFPCYSSGSHPGGEGFHIYYTFMGLA